MRPLSVRLFGTFTIEPDHEELDPFAARKVQELFSYLLLHPDHPHTREHLATLLWSETPAAQARAYLRKALWQLQHALRLRDQAALLPTTASTIQLCTGPALWVDVWTFEHATARTAPPAGGVLPDSAIRTCQAAVLLYRGDLLAEWDGEWCRPLRFRLRQDLLALLGQLLDAYAAQGRYLEGCAWGERLLEHEPACETTHQRLMELRYQVGDRTGALRQYQRCVAALAAEFDAAPAPATTLLYEQMRSNQYRPPGVAPPVAHAALTTVPTQPVATVPPGLWGIEH